MTKWQSSNSHFKTKIAGVHEPWHTQGPLSWDLSAWYVRLSIFCIKSLDEAKFSLSGTPKKFFSKLTFSLSIILLLMGAKMACFTHNFVGNKGRNVTWNLSVLDPIRHVEWKTGYNMWPKIFLGSSGGPAWRSTSMALYKYCVPNWWCTRYVFFNSPFSPSSKGGLLRSYPPCFNCPSKRSPEPLRS